MISRIIALACPSCGAEVRFHSALSVFAVCEYCRSTLLRNDLTLEHFGKMAYLGEDFSPLQLGSSGSFEGRSFMLIGRLEQRWSDGSWNEWYAYFGGGESGWLAEAQGSYMMSFDIALSSPPPSREELSPGTSAHIENVTYTVDDRKEVTCSYSEGELPFPAPLGRRTLSVDVSDGRMFGCLDYSDEGVRFYRGSFVDFDALRLSNLRTLPGW
jgi:hypothetical protein